MSDLYVLIHLKYGTDVFCVYGQALRIPVLKEEVEHLMKVHVYTTNVEVRVSRRIKGGSQERSHGHDRQIRMSRVTPKQL